MESWYALYTKPKQEALVARQMGQRGLETFLPQYSGRRRGEAPPVQPLFPCYLFVRADLRQVGLSALHWTPGLRGIVSFGGVPARVPEEAIVLVHKQLARLEAMGSLPRARFQPGEAVRLKEGPLAGLEAVFEGPLQPAERVRILIRFLGQANRAVVPVDILEGIAPRQHPPRRTRGRGRRIAGVEG
jgi:transcription elongation factor/antiterminator RfaH